MAYRKLLFHTPWILRFLTRNPSFLLPTFSITRADAGFSGRHVAQIRWSPSSPNPKSSKWFTDSVAIPLPQDSGSTRYQISPSSAPLRMTTPQSSDRSPGSQVIESGGERGRNRTYNLVIKSHLLCQLSYAPVRFGWKTELKVSPIVPLDYTHAQHRSRARNFALRGSIGPLHPFLHPPFRLRENGFRRPLLRAQRSRRTGAAAVPETRDHRAYGIFRRYPSPARWRWSNASGFHHRSEERRAGKKGRKR